MYQMTGDREHRDKMLYWGKRADDEEQAQHKGNEITR
jgi:hypothetical protein